MHRAPTQELFTSRTVDHWAEVLRRGVDHLGERARRVGAPHSGSSVEPVAKLVADVDLDRPLGDVEEVLDELGQVYLDDAVWFHDPGYVAHLNCPVVIPALLAELYVSTVNSSLDTWDQSGGGTLMEQRLVAWTAERLGLGEDADGVFTSGGTQSNLQAMLLARGEAAPRVGGDLTRLRVLVSSDGHFSVRKAADLLGLGPDAVVVVPVDERRRMDVGALARELDRLPEGTVPMAVVATAGTTDFGAIDPLLPLARLSHAHDAWFHVDAAYGGGLLTSTRRRHLLDGVEAADSVTVDYHKTFFQPVSASALVVRDGRTLRHAAFHADYLNPKEAVVPNQVDKSLQTTRRFDALKLWTTLRMMGADAVGELFDGAIDLAEGLHARMRELDDVEVRVAPALSAIVFRYRPPGLSARAASELAPRIRAELAAGGRAVVAGTKVDGESWLKVTLLNPATSPADLERVLHQVRAAGAGLLADDAAQRGEVA